MKESRYDLDLPIESCRTGYHNSHNVCFGPQGHIWWGGLSSVILLLGFLMNLSESCRMGLVIVIIYGFRFRAYWQGLKFTLTHFLGYLDMTETSMVW